MSNTCFVIQPFDGGKFDKRFREIYSPAIQTAGFQPYRVDQDPSASIPIDEIEKKIRESASCLVDITIDNPNVWCKLGMAIALGKELCIVCSTERSSKYPFDVQHRQIIKYSDHSPGDFQKLEKDIVDRLRAISTNLTKIVELSPTNLVPTKGLATHQIACLGMLASSRGGLSLYYLNNLMEKAGYSSLAVNLAIRQLQNLGLIETKEMYDDGETFEGGEPTSSGWQWIEDNIHQFDLSRTPRNKAIAFARDIDEEVPF